jgi:GTP-binding protein Era
MDDASFRAGFVAVIGRPNTGKSTLVNALMNEKISIVTSKPQTTRHSILGILTEADTQIILVDTPGLHAASGKQINRVMNRAATASLAGADLILFVVEAAGWSKGDDHVLGRLKDAGIPLILVINKMDLAKRRGDLLPRIKDYTERGDFSEVVPISARRRTNLDRLLGVIKEYLPESEELFPKDVKTDRGTEFRVGEMLREKLLEALHEEVPYGLAVEILALEDRSDLIMVDAVIWVDKESHRGIVIGRGGERLKGVSTAARLELEEIFGRRFFLKAQVKLKENWSDNTKTLRQLGYEVPQ